MTNDIKERCDTLGVKGPNLEPKDGSKLTLDNLKKYNVEMLKIRKDAVSSNEVKQQRSEKLTRDILGIDPLDGHAVETINNRYREINTTLFTWGASLPPETQHARY